MGLWKERLDTDIERKERGFTLIEMMIVVMIIGILLAIAVPNFITARTNSRVQSVLADLNQIDTAKQQYALDNGLATGATVSDASALVPTYIQAWPIGPVTGTFLANPIGTDPTFNGDNAAWITTHCTGSTADSQCFF